MYQVGGFPLHPPPVLIVYDEREEQWRAASPIVEVGDIILGILFPLLFRHLDALQVCSGGRIPSFPCPWGNIGLLAAGFLEFRFPVVFPL